MLELQKIFLLVRFSNQIFCNKGLKAKMSHFFYMFFQFNPPGHVGFSQKWPVLAAKCHTRRKSFITQSKLMMFWWNKKFLKAYDILLLSPEKKIELDFGHGLCWPSFCPNRVLKEQFVKVLAIFFSELQYCNVSYRY